MSLKDQMFALWRESLRDKALLWCGGLHGFERETFRLAAESGLPSGLRHEQLFPLSLQEQQIRRFRGNEAERVRLRELLPHALTLDFSDQQLELISPPHAQIAEAEADIALLLRFVAGELPRSDARAGGLDEESLWAYSQPPIFGPDGLAAVRVARFADDADAQRKEKYREQLMLRYGKAKQSWTGIHYNFSLDPRLFAGTAFSAYQGYVHLARNLWRNFWLLELLFGCTPNLSPFYVEQVQKHFALGGVSVAPPPKGASCLHAHFAYGYRSAGQQMQYLNYNYPCAYWQSVAQMAEVESRFFARLQHHEALSSAKLVQDSRELYAPFRLKQLHSHGDECWEKQDCPVDYLELRIFDIDPSFGSGHYSGIYLPGVYLAHLLLLHSAMLESPPLGRAELLRCAQREQYVASRGLGALPPKLLQRAALLLNELGELAALIGLPEEYAQAVHSAMQALKNRRFRAVELNAELEGERENLLRHSLAWTQFLQGRSNVLG